MMKKVGLIILVFLAVVFIVVGVLLPASKEKEKKKTDDEIKYVEKYDVNLVDSTGFKLRDVHYNDGYEVALFFTSDEDYHLADIEITFYDMENTVVDNKKTAIGYVNANKEFVISTTVAADSVKKIDVKVIPEKMEEEENIPQDENIIPDETPKEEVKFLDSSKIKFTNQVTNLEDNKIKVSLTASNPFDQMINLINGYVLLYNEDTLVDMIYFDSINIAQGGQIFREVETMLYDSTGEVKYTDVKVIINELF